MNPMASMIESLVGDDPRRAADRLLLRICEIAQAHAGAVLVPQGEDAAVFLSHRLSLTGLNSLVVRFHDHQGRLAKGEICAAEGFVLAPLLGDDRSPLGWIYLGGPEVMDSKDLKPFLMAMGKAIGASARTPEKARVVPANQSDANRAALIRLLEENDWNIARVSQRLQVTRRTLYLRLAAFGITRKKVPRLAKPLPA